MIGPKNIFHVLFIALIGVAYSSPAMSQSVSYEFWPETDIWYRLNSSWRLSAFVPVTKYYESKNRDLNIILQADYAWGKTRFPFYTKLMDDNRSQQLKGWMVRGGFMEGWSLYESEDKYTEDMLLAELHKRTPLIGNYLLSMRLRTDFRWVGEEPVFSYRIRYRILAEKEYAFDNFSWVPYVSVEPFWDSRYNRVNRVRAIGGSTFSWGPRMAMEGNITYQYDETYATTNLYAVNIIMHLYFSSVRSKLETLY